jgi:glutamyl-tRNA synthetase
MRTRFPPSPTGFLHVGGLRTALYSYILAKQSQGTFLLRIEDTDRERGVPGAIENIVHALTWAGILPDEGVMLGASGEIVQHGSKGPYIQSERLALYREHAERLLESGHAYRCFCTPGRLEEMRREQETKKLPPMYDRHCLSLTREEVERRVAAGEPHVIRMKIPRERMVTFADDIRGDMRFHGSTIDDQVLLKSDGYPTYHLAHVIDDHFMEIDLVLRGEEWLSSTPKHLLLFEFFGWQAPRYAHVPLLLNPDKTKLSKRQGDVSVEEYRTKGYLPEALLNFLALLGWNPGTEQEVFSLRELIEQFSLERVQKSGAIFDLEKLKWLQGQWVRRLSLEEFAERVRPFVVEKYPEAAHDLAFPQKVALIQERVTLLTEAAEMLRFFYEEPRVDPDLLANAKQNVTREMLPDVLRLLRETLDAQSEKEWTPESLKNAILARASEQKLSTGQVLWPLRVALTGLPYSPGAVEVASALGKKRTLEQLDSALKAV